MDQWKSKWIKPAVALESVGKAAAQAGLSINEMARRHFGTPGRMGQYARIIGAVNRVAPGNPRSAPERIKSRYDKGTN